MSAASVHNASDLTPPQSNVPRSSSRDLIAEAHAHDVKGTGPHAGHVHKVEYDMPSLGDQIYQTLNQTRNVPTAHRPTVFVEKQHVKTKEDKEEEYKRVHEGDMPSLGDMVHYLLHPDHYAQRQQGPNRSPARSPAPVQATAATDEKAQNH